jgi:uncharacterized delta-60 repeat protein
VKNFVCRLAINPNRSVLFRSVPRAILSGMALAIASTLALAQAGQLDPTFANNGIFSDNFSGVTGSANAVLMLPDGKILAGGQTGTTNSTAGTGVVVRLNTNGTLDTSFGSGGSVMIKFGDLNDLLTGLALQPDGKILVAGSGFAGGSGQLVRLNADGSFDTSFGTDGFVALFPETPGGFVLQPDGKILLEGSSFTSNFVNVSQLQRYNSNGTLDTTFGTDGAVATLALGNITLLPSGKFLITSGGLSLGAVARYNTNGSLDTTFGISGQSSALSAPAVAVQSGGKIITAGTIATSLSLTGNSSGFGLMRFNASGTPDGTFGTRSGVVTPFPGFLTANVSALAIQTNGDVVAVGGANNGTLTPAGPFALARYLSTGQLDTTFGTDGLVTTSFGSANQAVISAVTLQTDGKVVVAGSDGAGDLVVARYLGQ